MKLKPLTKKIESLNWKKYLPYITGLFFIIVGYLFYQNLSQIEWEEVDKSLQKVSVTSLLAGLGLSLTAYTLYCLYDFLSLRILQEKLSFWKVWPTTFVSFSFGLNLGALAGGVGFRFRLYSGWGMNKKNISLLTLLSTITSWSGYIFLLSLILMINPSLLADRYPFSRSLIMMAGVGAMLIIVAYLLACSWGKKMEVEGHEFAFPPLSKALLQILLSCLQWSLAASIIYLFMKNLDVELGYYEVLFTFLIAGIAGVITHIPAGLGVLETIFLTLHSGPPAAHILAGLMCYRVVFYLAPLALSIPGYLYLEYHQKN